MSLKWWEQGGCVFTHMCVCFYYSVSKPAFICLFSMYVCVFYMRARMCVSVFLCLCVLVCVRAFVLSTHANKKIGRKPRKTSVEI